MLPLSGTTVVSIEQAVAAPLCTERLAQAGARVIKVERAEGDFARNYDDVVDGESAFFVWLNRGKESISLDFKDPNDADLLHRMISEADIFVQNLAPGAAERAGFGSTYLRSLDRRLITCDISGYGNKGPYRETKAYDLLVQCESGLASISGSPEAPGRVGISIADIACGVSAYGAIMQALFSRERTGEGASLEASLFDTLAEWMTVPLLHYTHGGKAPERIGMRHPILAPYGAYDTGDGKTVVFGVQNEREWQRFCAIVLLQPECGEDPRFCSNGLRVANRTDLDRLLERVFADISREDLTDRLRNADIAFGALNDVADLSRHPQLEMTSAATQFGEVQLPEHPIRGSEVARHMKVPMLNEHGTALRREFSATLADL